jgi:hypothetical protein
VEQLDGQVGVGEHVRALGCGPQVLDRAGMGRRPGRGVAVVGEGLGDEAAGEGQPGQ